MFACADVGNEGCLTIENMLSAGMNNCCDGIILTDKKRKILYVNTSYQDLSGFSSEELIGMTVSDLVRDGLYEQKGYPSAIDQRKAVHHIKVFNKTKIKVMITCKPIFNTQNDEIEMVVSNIRNIDELGRMASFLMTKDFVIDSFESQLYQKKEKKYTIDDDFVSYNAIMEQIAGKIEKVSRFDVDTLLEGETGTGKTTLAKLIYKKSSRSLGGQFVELNCGAIPHSLIESELFGYERGAFTGANCNGKKGLFEEADKGIIFLDEIEELGMDIQSKLLSVLQERKVRRLGGVMSKPLDFQVVAASNKPLEEMVKQGKFRQDLYYRLNVVPITIPSLRERKEDIAPLAAHYLRRYNQRYKTCKKFSVELLNVFSIYDWPGNIRELSNLVKSLVIISNNDIIQVSDLPVAMQENAFSAKSTLTGMSGISLEKLVAEIESEIILKALQNHGSLRKAANSLQINPSSLYRRMAKYNIHLNSFKETE